MAQKAFRLNSSKQGNKKAELPVEVFEEAVVKAVKLNEEFIPPYGSGASLFIPLSSLGVCAQVAVTPASASSFLVFAIPLGQHFNEAFKLLSLAILRGLYS